jgi:FdhD protein
VSHRAAVVAVRRVDRGAARVDHDLVAAEAPLLLTIRSSRGDAERPFGVLMRTPGDDRDLVLGFLFSDGVIDRADQIAALQVTGDRADVMLASGVDVERIAARAQTATSACGVCGRLTIEALDRRPPPPAGSPVVSAATIAALPARLQARQTVFAETGGLHAAGLFDAAGALRILREDVGRHNAVDKAIGAALAEGEVPLHAFLLAVSGRVAFEIVQKAAMAAVPIVVAVGAPSTLAIDAARAAGITLAGFVRHERFNVYTHADRVQTGAAAT